jgi:beta-N-acetylhexosaminidase
MQFLCRRLASLAIAGRPCYPRRHGLDARSNPGMAMRQMWKRLGTMLSWLLGLLLVLVNFNLDGPYLIMLRGFGIMIPVTASLAGPGLLLWRRSWTRRNLAGKLLVLMWCLPLPAMASAETAFLWRKQAVLGAEAGPARDLGQHFIVGYTSFDDVALLAAKGLIGGVYVSHHNIHGRTADALKSELSTLQAIRRAAGLPPLIVAADQEGGIVSHLSPQLSALPALSTLAGLPPVRRSKMAEEFGQRHGRELAALGITLNFAPVVDLLRTEPRNPFDFNSLISRRAISGDPSVTSDVALAYVRGLEASGVEATVKHFPGLGRVREDTHLFRANLDTPPSELEATDWLPFRQVLSNSNAYLMVGHVAVTAIDAERPASHSKRVIDDLIRSKLGFRGIIVTDDLDMGAIYRHDPCTAVVEALNAGVDLLLVGYDGTQVYRLFDCALTAMSRGQLDQAMLQRSAVRLAARLPNHPAKLSTNATDGSGSDPDHPLAGKTPLYSVSRSYGITE